MQCGKSCWKEVISSKADCLEGETGHLCEELRHNTGEAHLFQGHARMLPDKFHYVANAARDDFDNYLTNLE
jgi:hypothetical protein